MKWLLFSFFSIVIANKDPYNFRFAIGNTENSLTISWTTNVKYNSVPIINYGFEEDNLNNIETGNSVYYTKDSFHHHVTLDSLNYSTLYFFTAGDAFIKSKIKSFNSINNSYPLNIAIYGDMGVENSNKTMERLKNRSKNIDMFLHIGDVSYADDKGFEFGYNYKYETTYDAFFSSVSDFSNKKPYMVSPGNHDISCHSIWDLGCDVNFRNFTAFNSRFKMPSNGSKNMWYSFNFGPIHFISINTESDYPNSPTNPYTFIGTPSGGGFGNQLEWIENDLKQAVKNRVERPWIIVYGHRPMYSKIIFDWPLNSKSRVRNAFEKLFLKYNVDIYFAGHIHAYERNYKINKGKKDMNGIYHIITGAPGCQEKASTYNYLKHDYTAYYNYNDYGWGELVINSKNNLKWNYYLSKSGEIVDTFTFKKNVD